MAGDGATPVVWGALPVQAPRVRCCRGLLGGGGWRAYLRGGTAGAEHQMSDSDAVLAANLEFYRAFAMRDLVAMEALWARQAPVSCVHPGWPPLAGRDQVMESWQGILANPASPRIACYDERVMLYGETALVLCEEELDGGTLVASNLFAREDDAWKIVHHQAGQLVARPRMQRRPATPRSRLN